MRRRRREARPTYYLSAAAERTVRRALLSGATRDEAAALIGITRSHLDTRLRDQLADLRVGRGRRGKRDDGDWDIDEDEIARRCAAIQARWSDEERDNRRGNFSGRGFAG